MSDSTTRPQLDPDLLAQIREIVREEMIQVLAGGLGLQCNHLTFEVGDGVEEAIERRSVGGLQVAARGRSVRYLPGGLDGTLGDRQVVRDHSFERQSTHESSPCSDGVGTPSVGDGCDSAAHVAAESDTTGGAR